MARCFLRSTGCALPYLCKLLEEPDSASSRMISNKEQPESAQLRCKSMTDRRENQWNYPAHTAASIAEADELSGWWEVAGGICSCEESWASEIDEIDIVYRPAAGLFRSVYKS
jgi:hypothetical protein